MGAFFTNVLIRVEGEAGLARVGASFRARLAAEGLRQAEDGEAADRTVTFACSGAWIAVYDEGTDTGAADLSALGAALSAELGAHAVTVSVHDSDVLDLELFEDGARRDRYCSAPDYFGKPSPKRRKGLAGDTATWRTLLASGRSEAELAEAFGKKLLFAEETLGEIATLLGVEKNIALVGYRYAAEGHGPELAATLRFRLTARPAHETHAEGQPRLGPSYGRDTVELPPTRHAFMVGSPAQVAATARNLGGPGVGVEVWVEGEALDRGLVTVAGVNLVLGSPHDRNFLEAAPAARPEGDRMRVVASFPDASIPAGFVGDLNELMRARPDKMITIMHGSNVHTNVMLTALAPGEGNLRVSLATPGGGAPFVDEGVLEVAEAAPRPRFALSEVYPQQLEPLTARTTVFLLVSFAKPRAEAARFAAAAVREWQFVLGVPKALHLSVFHRDPRTAPTTKKGADLANLEAMFEETQLVSLSTSRGLHGKSSGASFGTYILPADGEDPPCPTFALWADVAGDPEKRALHSERLSTIARRAMNEGGLQAMVGAWGWAPTMLDSTPYEQVCGVHGHTLERSWLVRYLRGVAPGRLWLGEELAARVSREALAKVTRVEAFGAGLQIDVSDGNDAVRAVEEALEAILPSPQAWRTKG